MLTVTWFLLLLIANLAYLIVMIIKFLETKIDQSKYSIWEPAAKDSLSRLNIKFEKARAELEDIYNVRNAVLTLITILIAFVGGGIYAWMPFVFFNPTANDATTNAVRTAAANSILQLLLIFLLVTLPLAYVFWSNENKRNIWKTIQNKLIEKKLKQ